MAYNNAYWSSKNCVLEEIKILARDAADADIVELEQLVKEYRKEHGRAMAGMYIDKLIQKLEALK